MCLKSYREILLIFVIALYSNAYELKRHIDCFVYRNSSSEGSPSITYVKSVGTEDTIHYLWSVYKLPSVIIVRTTNDTKLTLDMVKIQTMEDGAILFSEKPLASIGLTISEIWQKSYKTDNADVKDVDSEIGLGLEFFEWNNITDTSICTDVSASINLKSSGTEEVFSKKGDFGIQFSTYGNEEPASDFPHLIYTGNSTQVKVSLDNFHSNSTRIRYGMGMTMFSAPSETCPDKKCRTVSTDSISDEFSPGIFSDIDIFPQCSGKDDIKGTFLSWRPVAYTSKMPSVANSSDAKLTSDCEQSSPSVARSIAELYFNSKSDIFVFNITFGTFGDGFYSKTKYTAWSFMMGTGTALHTKLSITAIVFVSVGLGALALFFITAAIFLTVRHCQKKDDDLLLSYNNIN